MQSFQTVPGPSATSIPSAPETPAPPGHARVRIAPASILVFCVVFWAIPLAGLLVAQYIDILLVVFMAVLLSTFLSPVVNRLEQLSVNRGVGIVLISIFSR